MPFFDLKKRLAVDLAAHLQHPEATAEALQQEFNAPPGIAMGHVALPCFRLGKAMGKPAGKLAQELAANLKLPGVGVQAAGPYANFRWEAGELYRETLSRIFTAGERYGSDQSGAGRCIVLEYCSPNIAKRLAFQHIRSTLLGNTLANIYDFLGYTVERINFVGDWGSQFARLLAAVEMWGARALITPSDVPGSMDHLSELYVRFHKELDQHPEYAERAHQCLHRLEQGDAAASELWQQIREISVTAMEKTLARMHASFNHVEGESKYISKIQSTLAEVKSKTGAKLSDGAWIVEVEGISTPALVQKRDGTTLYLTRDIAAAVDRFQRFSFEKMFYVVSEQQKLHFQLLFGVLKKMGCQWAERCEHVSFGTVLFGAEKMSTREGRVIILDDVLNEARDRALEECTKKNPALNNKEKVAEQVGIGAIVFGELSSHRTRDIEFNWENILALDGDTGPYVQYSLVRCYSLLEKAQEPMVPKTGGPVAVPAYAFSAEEEQLVLELSKFRSVLHQATRENEPHSLTHYLIDLAKAFNRFYYRFPVLQATDPVQREVRLNLVKGTGLTLLGGLRLLGIDSPKEM